MAKKYIFLRRNEKLITGFYVKLHYLLVHHEMYHAVKLQDNKTATS